MNNNDEKKRYLLVYENKNTNNFSIIDFNLNKDGEYDVQLRKTTKEKIDKQPKHTLAEIDAFTTLFNEKSFNIKLGNISNFDLDNVFIIYKYDGLRYLNAYFDNPSLYMKSLKVFNSKIMDPAVDEIVRRYTDKKDRAYGFYKANEERHYINDESVFKSINIIRFDRFVIEGFSDTLELKRIRKELNCKVSNYINFRGLYVSMTELDYHLKEEKEKNNNITEVPKVKVLKKENPNNNCNDQITFSDLDI